MPKEHDPYLCIDKILSIYWQLLEDTEFDPDVEDFVSAQSLKNAVDSLQQIKEEKEKEFMIKK